MMRMMACNRWSSTLSDLSLQSWMMPLWTTFFFPMIFVNHPNFRHFHTYMVYHVRVQEQIHPYESVNSGCVHVYCIPSGKRSYTTLHNYGKIHYFLMGKSPISTGPFSIRPTACPGETPLIERSWQRGHVEISVWTSGDMRSNRLVLLYILHIYIYMCVCVTLG